MPALTDPREPRAALEPLAIVGAGCRFPGGASTPEEYWALLSEGRDAITEGPPEAWRRDVLAHPDAYPHGGFLDSIDGFDWRAFHTSPREARFMDPQQRLALEVAWEAFEHAGMPIESLAGRRAAVAVGIMWPDYAKLQAKDTSRLDGYTVTGSGFAYAANRISAYFDLVGPSYSLDVMCASSLAAVHMACQSIWSGEVEMALAAGVNLILSPDTNVAMTKARILSPDGRCKTFDARANGFVRGEGAGAVVIKPASQAAADGDRVLALIRGSAFNHSGRNEWIMAPSRGAQAAVIDEACRRAGVSPGELDYVELHGTGTEKGDPIEAAALGDTVGRERPSGRPCRVGSVKTNIGHLDSAAGVAGLLKTALALQHGQVPPSLHFEEPNPAIDLDALGLSVQSELGDWPHPDRPRLAGVTSLALGAANAHVVLEGPPELEPAPERRPRPLIVPVSAEAPGALRELLGDHAALVRGAGGEALDDIAHTAALRRTHRGVRAAAVGATGEELAERLESSAQGIEKRHTRKGKPGDPVFVFSGQNCSWAGMGRGLLSEPAFASAIDECAAEVKSRADWDLREAIEQGDERLGAEGPPSFVQPALCAIQIALARLWRSWGIGPAAVVGHSVGEIAAACVAGALPLEEAMRVAIERGQVMERLHGHGRTAAVALAPERVAERIEPLGGSVWIAGVNAGEATVVAGEPEAVERLVKELQDERVQATLLAVHSAFHGGDEDGGLASDLAERLGTQAPAPADVPMVSTLTGEPLSDGEPTGRYWADQMVSPVRFRDAVARLVADGHHTFVEIGPHAVLRSALAANLREAGEEHGTVVPSLMRDGDERADMLAGVACLYELGHDVDWRALQAEAGRVVTLPRYRWQHERLWLDPPAAPEAPTPAAEEGGHPLLGRHVELAHATGSHMWQGTLDSARLPYLLEHRIDGLPVFPGSGYVELALAAAEEAAGWTRCELRDLRFERALVVEEGSPKRVQTLLEREAGGLRLSVHSEGSRGWTRHVTALVSELDGAPAGTSPGEPAGDEMSAAECYAGFADQGVDYGPAFQAIARAWSDNGSLLADLEAPASIRADLGSYRHHPALLDGWMHTVALAGGTGSGGFMPTEIPRLRVHGRAVPSARAAVSVRARGEGSVTADVTIADSSGRPLLEAEGLRLRQLGSNGDGGAPAPVPTRRYEVVWEEAASPEPEGRTLTGEWLVLSDRQGVGERAAERLRELGASVTAAFADEHPAPAALLDGTRFDSILHLWGLDAPAGLPNERDPVEDAMRLSVTSVLDLVRSLDDTPLWVVTRGSQAVGRDEDAPAPLAASAWGLCRTLAQERPALFGGLVDLDPDADPEDAAARLVACLERGGREDQLAVRGERTLAPRLMESDQAGEAELPELRPDAAYLVTGGLGGLGGATALRLTERGARHLVLVGRAELPPREEWDSAAGDARLGAKIATVRELEALGAEVHVAAADVGVHGSLESALSALRAKGLPPIAGAVHAAGVPGFDAVDEMSDEAARDVLRPKVEGTLALHHALDGEPLDFLVLFSSIAALLSSPQMGHYAAGNAFQGAFAAHRRRLGLPAQALYWGIWGEVGMAVDAEAGPRTLRGHRGLSTEDGMRLMAGAMQDGSRDVALFEMDWDEWRSFYPRSAAAPLLERVLDAAPAPERSTPQTGEMSDQIVALVAEILKLPTVDPEESLPNVGFDSLMAAELRVRIEDEHGVRIPMLRILEAPSIGALAETVIAASDGTTQPTADSRQPTQAAALVQAPPNVPTPAHRSETELDILDEVMLSLDSDKAPVSVHCEVRVEGRIDERRLEQAIRDAARAHPVARSHLGRPGIFQIKLRWQIAEELDQVPLEVVDCEDEAGLARARERHLSQVPPLDRSTFTVLLAHHEDGDAIVLNIHHGAGDGVAAFRFMISIVRAYAGEPDPQPEIDPFAVRDVRALIGTSARDRAKRMKGYPDSLRRLVRPPARLATPAAGGPRGYGFELFTLTPDDLERVLDKGPRGATLNDVMLGALGVAVRRWNERHGARTGDVHLMMPVNVRGPGWSMDVFGNFASWTAVLITPKEHAELTTAVEGAARRTRRIRENGIAGLFVDLVEFPHSAIPARIARHAPKLFPARVAVDTALLSNVGHVDGAPASLGDAGEIREFWGTPPGHAKMGAAFSVASFRSRLFVGLRYDRSKFDAASAHALAMTYRETLLGPEDEAPRAAAREPAMAGQNDGGDR